LRTRFIWAATALDPRDKPRVSEVVLSEAEEDPDPDPDGLNSGIRSELAAGTVEPWTMANGSLSQRIVDFSAMYAESQTSSLRNARIDRKSVGWAIRGRNSYVQA